MSVAGITQNTAADMAGVTQVTIHRHVKSGDIKTLPNGRIDPRHFAQWLKDREPRKPDGNHSIKAQSYV